MRLQSGHRLELIDAAVGHQRQEEVTIPDDVGPDEVPMLYDHIMQRPGRAHPSRESERTELGLTWADRLPRASTPVAIDAHVQTASLSNTIVYFDLSSGD